MEQVQSALDLFRKYHGRYPVIEMAPFHLGGLTEAGRLYLMPKRGVKALADRQLLVMRKYPYVDVFEAKIRSRTDFKPERGKTPQVQQQEALWKKVSEEYFAKRRFTVHLGSMPSYYQLNLREHPMLPARFRVWRKMRGLVLDPKPTEPALYLHWSAFVPAGTPEHDAIRASLDLAERANDGPLKPSAEEIAGLQAILREKIALVPA